MSRATRVSEARLARFPRVSGDEPTIGYDRALTIVFSPRERG